MGTVSFLFSSELCVFFGFIFLVRNFFILMCGIVSSFSRVDRIIAM